MNIYNKYAIDRENFSRFDQREIVFSKIYNDKSVPFYMQDFYDNVENIVLENKEGYSRLDFARIRGAWSVYDNFTEAFGKSWGKDVNAVAGLEKQIPFNFESSEKMTQEIKKTAKIYGALKTGITKVDPNWIYSHNFRGRKIQISEDYQYAIVVLIPMDPF